MFAMRLLSEVEVLEVRGAYKVQRRKFVVTGIEVLSAVQSVTDKLSRWLLWQLSVSRVDEDWRSRATSRFDAMLRLLRAGTSDISNSVRRLLFTAIFTRVGQSVKSTSVSLLRDTFTSVSMGSPLNVTAASLLRDTSTFARALKRKGRVCGQLFIFPLDFSHVVAYNCDSFPCGRVFEICYFQSFGIGPVFFGRLSQKILEAVLARSC